jgi:hypothetical protein
MHGSPPMHDLTGIDPFPSPAQFVAVEQAKLLQVTVDRHPHGLLNGYAMPRLRQSGLT